MNVLRVTFLVLVTVLLTSLATKADNPDALLGRWMSSKKRNHVEIFKQGNKYFGKLVWMAEPLVAATKQPKVDVNNPDERLRTRQLLNMTTMVNFMYKGNNTWEGGEVYNPEDGRTYTCTLTLKDPNTLDIHGYILGMPFLGKTKTWTRVK